MRTIQMEAKRQGMAKKGKLLEQTELTPLQKRFCVQVAILHNVAAAARMVGVSDRTARRWHDMPLVQIFIQEMHEQAFSTAMQMLEQATLSAVTMLNEAMNSEHTENHLKVRAAQLILDYGIEAHKINVIEARMEAIEHKLKLHQIVVGEVVDP